MPFSTWLSIGHSSTLNTVKLVVLLILRSLKLESFNTRPRL